MKERLSFSLLGIASAFVVSCAGPPASLVPEAPEPAALQSGKSGRAILGASADAQGSEWNRFARVEVGYDGEWATFPKLTQPDLVDPAFRGSSREVYRTGPGVVEQTHEGPGGTKTVHRVRGDDQVEVSYNGEVNREEEVEDAAALVADAYAMFLFGASWLLDQGREFRYLGTRGLDGRTCELVEVSLAPGIGRSASDRAVAWIDAEDRLMRRVTFTLNGLESTRGAEVDVTMDEFVEGPGSSQWPTHFVEMIRKPVNTKAHEWWTTSLTVDGVRVR